MDKKKQKEGFFEKELVQRQLKFYLKQFYVKPSKSSVLRNAATADAKSRLPQGYIFSSKSELYQYGQALILSYNKRIHWDCVNSYVIVEQFLQGESVVSKYTEPDLLFITYGFNEIPNRQLHNMTNNIISNRTAYGKKTVILSTKNSTEFCISLKNFNSKNITSEVI